MPRASESWPFPFSTAMTAEQDIADVQDWVGHARRGEFADAWKVSDRILQRHRANADFTRPRHLQSIWMGEPLQGKRVLIRCYHGLGDTIQFIRYVPLVRGLAREVIVWAPSALIPLVRSVPGIDRLIPLHDGAPDVACDVDVEVMELPFVFRTTIETIPRTVPYLSVAAANLPGTAPRIGVVWRAGGWHHPRSVPFSLVASLLDQDRFTWCSLQLGRREDECHPALVDASSTDVLEAARLAAGLDLLITIDSMPAHLAGALGIPVWTLLLKDADWRWMDAREDSPWYPTMRLFRQEQNGDWAGVVKRVAEALRAY